jgi:hypothetical protein
MKYLKYPRRILYGATAFGLAAIVISSFLGLAVAIVDFIGSKYWLPTLQIAGVLTLLYLTGFALEKM